MDGILRVVTVFLAALQHLPADAIQKLIDNAQGIADACGELVQWFKDALAAAFPVAEAYAIGDRLAVIGRIRDLVNLLSGLDGTRLAFFGKLLETLVGFIGKLDPDQIAKWWELAQKLAKTLLGIDLPAFPAASSLEGDWSSQGLCDEAMAQIATDQPFEAASLTGWLAIVKLLLDLLAMFRGAT